MRITNKIMQRNNLANINTNKIYQDRLTNQMSTQKKINRPSDDPVVAIRALRLRSNVTEITQYYSKNIPDAESWLSVTEDALKNLTDVVTNMISQCTKGSNGDLTSEDRQIILEQLKALGEEIYATADADYAGRYVFAGYRTDTSISFLEDSTTEYTITEQLDNTAIDQLTKVNTDRLLDLNANNFASAEMSGITEQGVESVDVYRIRLAYKNCSEDATPSVNVSVKQADGSYRMENLWTHESEGGIIKTMHYYEDPYTRVAADPNAVVYVPETGELLLGDKMYAQLMDVKDDITTVANEGEIQITYQKNQWETGDLKPEHYFYCTSVDEDGKQLTYNADYLTGDPEHQVIEYDVGFNQTIRVNSTADECFGHGIGRQVEDLVNSMEEVVKLEAVKADLEKWQKENVGNDAVLETISTQLDAVNKALTLAKDKNQKLFESSITAFQKHLDDANLCITNCGTRSSKLELIKNRMQSQKTTFETLKSENEDADITEVAIQLNSAELTYEAALMATGKVMQTTLLNFI